MSDDPFFSFIDNSTFHSDIGLFCRARPDGDDDAKSQRIYVYIHIFFSFKEIEENALTNAFSFVIVFFSFFAYTENEFFFSHDSFGDKNLMKRRLIDVFLIRDFLHKSSDRYLPGNVTVMKKKMLQRDEEENRRLLRTMTQEQHALLSYHTRVMHSF